MNNLKLSCSQTEAPPSSTSKHSAQVSQGLPTFLFMVYAVRHQRSTPLFLPTLPPPPLQGSVTSTQVLGPTGSAPFLVVASSGSAIVDSSLAQMDPVDLAGRDFNGEGCTVTAAPPPPPDAAAANAAAGGGGGGVLVSCKELRLTEVIETGGATAELDIRGSLEAAGSLAGALQVEAADIPGGEGGGRAGGEERGGQRWHGGLGEGGEGGWRGSLSHHLEIYLEMGGGVHRSGGVGMNLC